VYETGRQGEHIYFTMEYFRGVTAAQMLRERKRLPTARVVEIAGQAADALAYAHAEGRLVHRDIKPENLLVDQWNHVKLLDFGLARIEGVRSITQAGTVVGSLYYVSPEQLLGQPLDGRTDVYALGVSMYEMLTGQRPYVGQTLPEMSDVILTATAVPPSQIEPAVPPELERIVARAMARDLGQRYRDAGEMRDDLRVLYLALAQPQRSLSATSTPSDPTPAASSPRAAPNMPHVPTGGDPRMGGRKTGYPRSMRTTLRPTSLEPVPTQQREAHLTQRPRSHDQRG
jgi:serine/threonine-protein kinase